MSLLLLSGDDIPATIAPKPTGFGWGGAADGLGFRLTSMRNALVAAGIDFVEASLADVITMEFGSRDDSVVSTAELVVTDFDFDDPDDWFVVFGGSNCELTVRGTVDQDAGVEALVLRPKLTAEAWAAPTTVLRGVQFNHCIAPIGGDPATCRVMVPGIDVQMESEVRSWLDPEFAGEGASWNFPGQVWGGDLNGLPYDEPKGLLRADNPAATADLYFWDNSAEEPTERIGACFRIANATGAARIIRLRRDESNNLWLSIIFVCQDCSIGVDGASDTDFADGLQMRPMVGTDFDALRWCGAREEAEGWAWAANGPIGTNPILSNLAEQLLVSGYADGGHLLASFEPYFTCYDRLKTLWELAADEMFVQAYRAALAGTRPPNVAPFEPTAATWLAMMHDAGIATLIYEDLLEPWSLSGGSGIDSGDGIWGSLARTRVGYTISGYGDLGNLPISNGETVGTKFHLNPVDPVANEAYIDGTEAELQAELGVKRRGSYSDIAGNPGPHPDDNPALTSAQRSIGSTTFAAATRAFHELRRSRAAAAGIVDPALAGEFVNPMTTVGAMDVVYSNPINPPGGIFYGRTCGSPAIKYGRHANVATYADWASPHGPQWDAWDTPDWATPLELRHFTALRWFCSGMLLPMQRIWLDDDPTGFVIEPGEDRYLEYLEAKPFLDFAERLYLSQRQLVKDLLKRSVFMRDLDCSMKERALAYHLDGVSPQVPAAKVGGVMRYITHLDLPLIALGNWSRQDGNPATVAIEQTLNLAGWPELGAGARDVYLWNILTGARLELPGWDGSSMTLSLSIPPEFVGAVLFVAEGEEPPYMGWLSGEVQEVVGEANVVQEVTGVI